MTLIEFAYERHKGDTNDYVTVHAVVGGEASDQLVGQPIKDGLTEQAAVIKAIEWLFDTSDFANSDDLEDLEREFNMHTHGQPE
jgi:hypothetical protein